MFYKLAAAAAVVMSGLTFCQEMGVDNTTTPTTTEGEITIHYVTVGETDNQYLPNSINAVPGDIVSFQFYPSNHSVIRAAYGYPCVPYEDVVQEGTGFYSGAMAVADTSSTQTWNLTINDTSPVFYYCGAPGSCVGWGMVGVINPNSSTSLATQIELAKQAQYMLEPGQSLPPDVSASIGSMAATATTATLTVTATNSLSPTTSGLNSNNNNDHHHNQSSSSLSTGAIVGIAVGAAAAALCVAALFFMMGRTKSLKDEVARHRADQTKPPYMPMDTAHNQSRHTSQLPAYQQYIRVPEDQKSPNLDPFSTQATPYTAYGQQFAPNHDRQFRFSEGDMVELGAVPPRARSQEPPPVMHEMYAGNDMAEIDRGTREP